MEIYPIRLLLLCVSTILCKFAASDLTQLVGLSPFSLLHTTQPAESSPEEQPANKEDEKPKEDSKAAAAAAAEEESTEDESLGFGFINFVNHESAAEAVKEMNDKEYTVTEDGETFAKVLYVGRAQKKSERERELRAQYESEKMDRIAKFQGVNL